MQRVQHVSGSPDLFVKRAAKRNNEKQQQEAAARLEQCFLYSRNIGQLTPNSVYLYYKPTLAASKYPEKRLI